MRTIAENTQRRQRAYLQDCFRNGQCELPRATDFWSQMDAQKCLAGERKLIGSGVTCISLLFTGSALLVMLTDSKGKDWYSWIHDYQVF